MIRRKQQRERGDQRIVSALDGKVTLAAAFNESMPECRTCFASCLKLTSEGPHEVIALPFKN